MPTQWARTFVFASIIGLVPSVAFAQAATALDRFEPAPAGDGSFAVPRPDVVGHLNPTAALTLSYAHAPLQMHTYDVASGQTLSDAVIVSHQFVAHVMASIDVAKRLKFDLDVPFTLSQGGDSPVVDTRVPKVHAPSSRAFSSPSGAAMNDIRLGARLALLRQQGWLPAVSVAYSVWFPSGNAEAYTGTGSVRHAPSLIVGWQRGRYAWSVMAGRRVQDNHDGAGLFGSEILGGASFSARFDKLTAHGEVFGSAPTNDTLSIVAPRPNLELLVGARYPFGRFSAGLMGGPGLLGGVGTPTFRVLATLSASFDSLDKSQRTNKGLDGSNDKPFGESNTTSLVRPAERPTELPAEKKIVSIPKQPEVPDRDGDTVPDAEDVCPDIVGDTSPTATRRGCPPDRDADGIPDADDRCPDQKGVATPDLARFGCPLDSDGDGFIDDVDACPNEKGVANEDAKKNGCPLSVRVEGTQIVILQEVNFATGSDLIAADSFALLEQVAAVFTQHPEIARVAVDGHTDNSGSEKENVALSQKRAVAVVNWLIEHGIDARRLEARGFGPRRPIASNKSAAGKAKNRRVEFQILKRSSEGATGWSAGSVQ